ncbi:BTB/POZ and MATH domain-containing protein 2 [Rhynchospora pubera]|uniref:BTB/POZ and MATH domain-containing protein 2 n=1 Tax=Rhynchospora pubera TaxID=906938 RepID=A0AAV8EFS7_9POAL|nr:BTB/POZ and MATH domain-containing protein 2 [Rhynchospora pubera]
MDTWSLVVRHKKIMAIPKRIVECRKGSYLLKVAGYSLYEGIGAGSCISSPVFTIGGYNWTIDYYPDGDMKGAERFAIFIIVPISNVKDLAVKLNFTMLAHDGKSSSNYEYPTKIVPNIHEHPKYYLKKETLEASKFLKGDSFRIRFTIEIIKEGPLEKTVHYSRDDEVTASNLSLVSLLETGEGADVSFIVGEDIIRAHKYILAARSRVFKAQFFGPMEGKKKGSIKVKDMEASIFEAMLHFIYSDSESLPVFDEVEGNRPATVALAQHLLVAADMYGLERLKRVCEKKLYEFLDVDNLATTLALAVQHYCSDLKDACMHFVKAPYVLGAVALAEEFEHMITIYPTFFKELRQLNTAAEPY